MANPEHLKILQQGVGTWNKWRKQNPQIVPDLRSAILRGLDFSGADFVGADFSGANLIDAICRAANFQNANLGGAHFIATNFTDANLEGANMAVSDMSGTIFGNTNLSNVKGLNTCHHRGPSTIDLRTFQKSGKLPEVFLRGCGLPDEFINYLPSFLNQPLQFDSCFISHSTKDDEFVRRLYSSLQAKNIRCWFAPEDMKGGDYFHEQIDRAIQLHDRLVVVLSENSIQSKWVEREIRKARKVERAEKRRKLFPITLTDYTTLKKWECLDSDTGEDLAEEVRKYHIPDFSNWKNHDDFEKAFIRLEQDLRKSIGNK